MNKLAFALALLLATACQASPAAVETSSAELHFEQRDAGALAEQVRPLMQGTGVRIEVVEGNTWLASGPADEVNVLRAIRGALDGPVLTPEHVPVVREVEHVDPRTLTNSARGRSDWGASWIVAAGQAPRWYALVPRDEVPAFEALLDELDRPD